MKEEATAKRGRSYLKPVCILSCSVLLAAGVTTGVYFSFHPLGNYGLIGYDQGKIPFSRNAVSLELEDKTEIGTAMVSFLSESLEEKRNDVFSPASFALSLGETLLVSGNVRELAGKIGFGENYEEEFFALLEGFNWEEKEGKTSSYLRAMGLLQQVGEHYAFDEEKVKEVTKGKLLVSKSTRDKAIKEAENIYERKIGMTMDFPDIEVPEEGVLLYGGIKLVDTVYPEFSTLSYPFSFEDGREESLDCRVFFQSGHDNDPYYKGENYAVLSLLVQKTRLVFILPDEGYALEDVDVSEAYREFKEKTEYRDAYGFVPYFSTESQKDLTCLVADSFSGEELFCDRILEEEVDRDLIVNKVIQGNSFTFEKKGVQGESLTITEMSKNWTTMPEESHPVEFRCDRPFYCISEYDDFPLFVNQVYEPGL